MTLSPTDTKTAHTLAERVHQFQCMELPGQPMMMHMGTSYLVHDLWRSHQNLLAALKDLKAWIEDECGAELPSDEADTAIARAEGRQP